MADDQASQRRSRLGPPPAAGANPTSYRATPSSSTSSSRFGFGSSTPRTAFGSTTASPAARATTLSTARPTTTFSSSAFGRSTLSTTRTPSSQPLQRPSSAEHAGSRLRQKPTTTTAAAASSAPKQTTTSDLFATLASDSHAPRSSSGSALPMVRTSSNASSVASASSAFSSSAFAASAVAAKPAGQLFSMDDADLGDDGWGVDSPSNILSPASATDETATASSAGAATKKPFEDEDEFGWADDAAPPAVPEPSSVKATLLTPVPTPTTTTIPTTTHTTTTPASASTTGWGDEFEYTADATEAAADASAWKDEDDDQWGVTASETNGAASATTSTASKSPVEPLVTAVAPPVQAQPLSTASADLGAILSPGSGPAGEFWGDEGDDVLFSDEEQADAAPAETPHADVGAQLEPTTEATKPVEETPVQQPAAGDFSYQEEELNHTVTEAVPDASEWEDEGNWGDELRLSEVTAEAPLQLESTPAPVVAGEFTYEENSLPAQSATTEYAYQEDTGSTHRSVVNEFSYQEDITTTELSRPEGTTSSQPVVNEPSFSNEINYPMHEIEPPVGDAVAVTNEWEDEGDWGEELRLSEVNDEVPKSLISEPVNEPVVGVVDDQSGATVGSDVNVAPGAIEGESHDAQELFSSPYSNSATEQSPFDTTPSTSHFENTPSSSHFESLSAGQQNGEYYEYGESSNEVINNIATGRSALHHEGVDHREQHVSGKESHFEDAAHSSHLDGSSGATATMTAPEDERVPYEKPSSEMINRQVSWEANDDASGVAVIKDSMSAENGVQPVLFAPPSIPTSKAEVTFGTSSFAAAELTYGHYHHDHHRTPSEAEVGSVASFAEASSAGATFGGSDHVSDGTYSDGDYASETRSVFGSSSAHSTAFITEPPSSSDGQGSNEDTGTYDHHSDMSSTVGGGGGAPSSEFDVSSTRSALFENEVTGTGFEQSDETYEYGDHGHHNHFSGGSYEADYHHDVADPSAVFSQQSNSSFGQSDDAIFSSHSHGQVPKPQQTPSPVYSRSSTPATYGASSSQDLPTASDLEFEHSDAENLFASSSSEQDSAPLGTPYHSEDSPSSAQSTFATPPVVASSDEMSTPPVDNVVEEANPFVTSGFGFPSAPAPVSDFDSSPVVNQNFEGGNEEVLQSASSLFGPSPAKGSPFGSFAPSPPVTSTYEETPITDAGSLFADAPAASAFGGKNEQASAPASNFFGDAQSASQSYGYESASQHYAYQNSVYPPANEAFGDSDQSHGFGTDAYGYDSSYQSASEAFSSQSQSNGFDGFSNETYQHQSVAEAFGAPPGNGFAGQENADFQAHPPSSHDTVGAESFFGGASASPSAGDMFASSATPSYHDQNRFARHQDEGYGATGHSMRDQEHDQYQLSPEPTQSLATDHSKTEDGFEHPPSHHPETSSGGFVTAETPEMQNNLGSVSGYDENWSYGESKSTEQHSFDYQRQELTSLTSQKSSAQDSASSPVDQSYTGFDGATDADSFFGQSSSATPFDSFAAAAPSSESAIVPSAPAHKADSPTRVSSPPPFKPAADTFSAGAPTVKTEPQAQLDESRTIPNADPAPFDGSDKDHVSHGFEVAGQPEFAASYSEQSHENAGLDFGGGSSGAPNPFEQATEPDSAAFFGGAASGAFDGASGNDASGFFSSGPKQYHHSGGIYAQSPQNAESTSYYGYDAASYAHQQENYGAYATQPSDFVSSNEYAYDAQDQHQESFAAHPTPSHENGVGYGSAASYDVRSPTGAANSHIVSAQLPSMFQNESSTMPGLHSTSQGGQQQAHPDAAYRTPTFHPSASPKTPTMDMSLSHGTTPHNYNQFAAPQQPGYGSSYEMKHSYGEVATSAKVLTSNKHKDPNMVVPSCLSSFGFGGNVVTMFPKQKLRLNSASFAARNSPRTPQSMQYDNVPQGELRKGPIGVYRMEHVHPRNSDFEELDKFPGPLNDSVAEEAILQYVEEKMNSSAGSTHQEEDERLLLGVLRVLIKCNGRLRSEAHANPSEPTSPEVQLVSLLKESDQRRRRNHPSHFPPPKPVQYPTHSDAIVRNSSRVRELLLLGDRKAAVDVAIQAQMWPEAMLIGSFTDKDEYKRVLCAYFTSHYAPGDPCRALYLSFADQQEKSIHEPQKLMQQSKDDGSSAILSSWVVHVQMLLANRTADTNKILVELGDRLWKEANAVVAAHVCYLLAGNTVEAPSPNSKIALLGADHRSPDEARFYVSPAAVQRTEIYEWVQKKINPAATNMIPFQGYKLIYAMILADHGKLETAFKYVNSMLTVIRAITATMKPGTSMYLEGMQNQLIVLDDRLRQHLGQDRADSVAAAASAKQGKWGLGSALSIMGKIVNRVVEGNDAPQQAGPPRSANGSLFPGAPRSNNNNVPTQPEYPSGAAIGYSSQLAPTMVPTAPGSGRSGGIYGSHTASYNNNGAAPPTASSPVVQAPPAAPQAVPAAFNVPRQMPGRNSAPPHHPTPDYAMPKSGSGGHAFGGPPADTSAYNAPPPQQEQPAQSFPPAPYNSAPPAEAPKHFQKPSLDLSGSAGNSGFGNEPAPTEVPKPKSPPRSPRARSSDAPGSDKGSSSPKAKEAPKKSGRSKTPPPSRSSSGWLSGISTFIAAKMNPDAKVAKLGEHMDAYFDEEKKRWVFPGETQADEPTMPSAPPTGPLPGSTPASMSGGPPGGPPGTHSAPGSMAGGASPDDPLAALMAPPPARAHASLMKKDPLAAMMAPPPNRAMFGQQRGASMPAKRPPPRPQFAVFKPAPGSTASSAPSEQGPPSSSGEPPAPPQ